MAHPGAQALHHSMCVAAEPARSPAPRAPREPSLGVPAGHEPGRREDERRCFEEPRDKEAEVRRLEALAAGERITLVFGAKDEEHHNAVALADYMRDGA
ncbi:MAG: DUF488 family protein [Myxococcota bacterium]